MLEALIISNILLWILLLALSFLVFALIRQIGVLHERVFPAGALMTSSGPQVGEAIEPALLTAFSGQTLKLGGADEPGTLLLFLSPGCPICKTLLPYLNSVRQAEDATLRIVLVSDNDSEGHEALIKAQALDPDNYVLSKTLGLYFQVDKIPFAALIDDRGILRAKGMVNSREHLESLFEARNQGVATLQEYFMKTEPVYETAR